MSNDLDRLRERTGQSRDRIMRRAALSRRRVFGGAIERALLRNYFTAKNDPRRRAQLEATAGVNNVRRFMERMEEVAQKPKYRKWEA